MGAARHFVRACLEGDGRAEDAALVVSELATNAVRHAGSLFTVTVILREPLRVEVADELEVPPALRSHSPGATDGRGLRIVDAVASSWGTRLDPAGGKVVWAVIGAPRPDAPVGGAGV